jgi:hypothetical protein
VLIKKSIKNAGTTTSRNVYDFLRWHGNVKTIFCTVFQLFEWAKYLNGWKGKRKIRLKWISVVWWVFDCSAEFGGYAYGGSFVWKVEVWWTCVVETWIDNENCVTIVCNSEQHWIRLLFKFWGNLKFQWKPTEINSIICENRWYSNQSFQSKAPLENLVARGFKFFVTISRSFDFVFENVAFDFRFSLQNIPNLIPFPKHWKQNV